jgi:hypothetical protein
VRRAANSAGDKEWPRAAFDLLPIWHSTDEPRRLIFVSPGTTCQHHLIGSSDGSEELSKAAKAKAFRWLEEL